MGSFRGRSEYSFVEEGRDREASEKAEEHWEKATEATTRIDAEMHVRRMREALVSRHLPLKRIHVTEEGITALLSSKP